MPPDFAGPQRRAILASLLGAWLAAGARAQTTPARRILGWLTQSPPEAQTFRPGILARLAALGHQPGRDIDVQFRSSYPDAERLPALARELVALRPAVIVAGGNAATRALKQATNTIPIVMVASVNPVALGLVASLARPGGNVTGATNTQPELGGKALEVLHTAMPKLVRVTAVQNPDVPGIDVYLPAFERAEREFRLRTTRLAVRRPEDFSTEALLRTQPEAVMVSGDSLAAPHAPAVIRLARQHRWPTLGFSRAFVEAGGLMTLSLDQGELEQNVADIIDQLLRGARPADIPVREPSRYRLVLNQRAAREIEFTFPRELLLQASEVIE